MNEKEQEVTKKLTYQQITIRTIISFVIIGVISLILLWTIYDFEWTTDNVSNSVFITSVPICLISVVLQTGATRVTLGMTYATKWVFTYRKMKDEYDNFGEYFDEKAPTHVKNVIYVIIASLAWIGVALILSALYLQNTPNF